MDELQKTAQESELDHTNTSPEMFVFFVLAQVVVTQLIATYAIKSPRFTMMAVFGIGSHWIGFILSMLLKTNKFYDITEDISILAMLWWSYTTIEDGEPSVRQKRFVISVQAFGALDYLHLLDIVLSFVDLILDLIN